MTIRARLARLEVQSAIGQDPRKLTDEQLDAEIARLTAIIDPADLPPRYGELDAQILALSAQLLVQGEQ